MNLTEEEMSAPGILGAEARKYAEQFMREEGRQERAYRAWAGAPKGELR